jgi:hypothetical protein
MMRGEARRGTGCEAVRQEGERRAGGEKMGTKQQWVITMAIVHT